MEFITVQAFKIDELPAEVQKKVIEKLLNKGFMDDVANFDVQDALSNVVAEWALGSGLKVLYSLGYCQGDGCSVEGRIAEEDFSTHFAKYTEWKEKYGLLDSAERGFYWYLKVSNGSSHYVHANTMCFEWEVHSDWHDTFEVEFLRKLSEEFKVDFEKWLKDQCKAMDKVGYDVLEAAKSEERIIADCNEQEFLFNKNGVRVDHLI